MPAQSPLPILSASEAAGFVGVSHTAMNNHIRRGLLVPDYSSAAACFFKPESLPAIKKALKENRQRHALAA